MNTAFSRLALTSCLSFSLLASARAVTYSIDGGTAIGAAGDTAPSWSAAALNHFTVVAGGQNINSVSVMFGAAGFATNLAGGEPFSVVIWNDPNGDGNPADATVLSSAAGTITTFNDSVTFQTTPIPPVGLSVGQSFFAGVYFQSVNNQSPLGVTLTGTPTESWVAYNAATPVNLNSLATSNAFGLLQSVVSNPPGLVAMVRANGVPEPASFTLAGIAALGLLRRRRA